MCAFCFSKDQDDCVTPADGVEDVSECRLGTRVPNHTDQNVTRELGARWRWFRMRREKSGNLAAKDEEVES